MRKTDHFYETIALHEPDRFRQRHVRRQQDDAQVCRDERHRKLLGASQMSKKFRVTWKTITAEKQRALIDRRGRDRIDISSRTQLDRCLDVTSRSFARSARLNAGLDEAVNVVEMVNDGFGERIRKRLSNTNDVVTGLQIKSARRVGQQLRVADYYGHANSSDFFFGDRFETHFRPDAGRESHRDTDARQNPPRSRSRSR